MRRLALALAATALAGPLAAQDTVSTTPAPGLTTEGDLEPMLASALMQDAQGGNAGTVTLRQLPAGVLIEADLENLAPGPHAIHIHETGTCTPSFESAGGHFAPEGNEHGFAATATPHAGDLPNIVAGEDGRAQARFLNARATLGEGERRILDIDGAAIIVHENADDYRDEDSAGGRVACGVIRVEG